MNLRAVDLNLLVIFDALMGERNLTRAAHRIGMSQPAMSNALARLRQLFGEDLFIRAVHGMEPTSRALELADPVRAILRQAQALMSSDLGFDPGSAQRIFTLRMSDLVGALLLSPLLHLLRQDAPSVSLDVVHLSPESTLQALQAGQLDLAVSMDLEATGQICAQPLLEDRMCCLMRADHPLAQGRLTLQRFLAATHVKVTMSPTDTRFVDRVLNERGHQRRVALNLPHWLLVPAALLQSDLLAVVSERLASQFLSQGLITRPIPFRSGRFHWTLYWHRRQDGSAAHRWLRELVVRSCESSAAGLRPGPGS